MITVLRKRVNRSSDDDSSENESIQSDNSDDNLEGSYIDMCENEIVQNNLLRRLAQISGSRSFNSFHGFCQWYLCRCN